MDKIEAITMYRSVEAELSADEVAMKPAGINKLMSEALVKIATDHADELEHNRKLADRMGGLLTMSQRATIAKGPLAGHIVEVSIAIDPETDDAEGCGSPWAGWGGAAGTGPGPESVSAVTEGAES